MILLLAGCATFETWTLEMAPLSDASFDTDDGCTITLSGLDVVAGWPEVGEVLDATASSADLLAGPTTLTTAEVEVAESDPHHFRTGRFGELLDGAATVVSGIVSCDRDIEFELRAFEDVRHTCSGPLDLPGTTVLEIDAAALFDDGAGAMVGQTWIDADGDEDSVVDEEELEYARLSQLDYDSDAEHLLEHARWQTGTWVTDCTPESLAP